MSGFYPDYKIDNIRMYYLEWYSDEYHNERIKLREKKYIGVPLISLSFHYIFYEALINLISQIFHHLLILHFNVFDMISNITYTYGMMLSIDYC